MARLTSDGTIVENYDRFSREEFNAKVTNEYWNGVEMVPISDSLVDNSVIFKNNPNELGIGGYSIRALSGPLNVLWFGAKGDGVTDDTKVVQKALDTSSLLGRTLYFPPGEYIISDTLYTPKNFMICGEAYGPVSRDSGSHATQQSYSRLVFTKPNSTMFLPKEIIDREVSGNPVERGQMRVEIKNIGFNYNKIYYSKSPSDMSSSCFDRVLFAGHSRIEGVQINAFNVAFNSCSFGQACRIVACTFREIGQYVIKGSILGDSFWTLNYFNGARWAHNGCIAIEASTINMTKMIQNWFEFFNTGIQCSSSNNAVIEGNIFDYTYRPIVGFGFLSTIIGNGFNHISKNWNDRFLSLDEDHPMRTEDWIAINIVNATRNVSIVGNIGQRVDQLISVSSTGTYGTIQTSSNSGSNDSGQPLSPDQIVLLNPPTSGYIASSVRIMELMFTPHTEFPLVNLFEGRLVFVNNILVEYKNGSWLDTHGEEIGYGNSNIAPLLSSSSWSKPTTGVSPFVYTPDGYGVSFSTTATNRFFVWNIPFVVGDRYKVSIRGMSSSSETILPIFEVRYLDSAGNRLGQTSWNGVAVDKVVDVNQLAYVDQIATLQIRFGGSSSSEVNFSFDFIQVYKYLANSYSLTVWDSGVKYRATSFSVDKQKDQLITGKWSFSNPITMFFPYETVTGSIINLDYSSEGQIDLDTSRTFTFGTIKNGVRKNYSLVNSSASQAITIGFSGEKISSNSYLTLQPGEEVIISIVVTRGIPKVAVSLVQ